MMRRRVFLRVAMVLASSGFWDVRWPGPSQVPDPWPVARLVIDVDQIKAVMVASLRMDSEFMSTLPASSVSGRRAVFPVSIR